MCGYKWLDTVRDRIPDTSHAGSCACAECVAAQDMHDLIEVLQKAADVFEDAEEDTTKIPERDATGKLIQPQVLHYFRCSSTHVKEWGPCDCWLSLKNKWYASLDKGPNK